MNFLQQIATLIGAVGKNTAALIANSRLAQSVGRIARGATKQAGLRGGNGQLDIGGAIEGSLTKVAARFLIVLAPLAILSRLLGEATSGFGLFMKTVKMLTTVVASVLMPPFIVLSALVLSATDIIAEKLIPNLVGFSMFVGRLFGLGGPGKKGAPGKPDMEFRQSDNTWHPIPKPGEAQPPPEPPGSGGPAAVRQPLAALVRTAPPPQPELFPGFPGSEGGKLPGFPGTPDGDRLNRENAAKQGATTDGKPTDKFTESVNTMLAELQRMNAPQAKLTGIASVWKEALMAGLQQSPLDRKMNEYVQRIVEAVVAGFQKAQAVGY